MKKLLIVVIALTAITLSSCKKDKNAEIENTYIGTWKVETITLVSESGESFKEHDTNENVGYDYFTEFKADGTINEIQASKNSNSGCLNSITYKIDNNQFEFTEGRLLYALDKGTLEFKDNNKIIISGSTNDDTALVIELTRTNKKLSDIDVSQCVD